MRRRCRWHAHPCLCHQHAHAGCLPPLLARRHEAPLLDSLDEVFYSLMEAGSPRERARLQQQFEALQKEVGNKWR